MRTKQVLHPWGELKIALNVNHNDIVNILIYLHYEYVKLIYRQLKILYIVKYSQS